ncbi:MAG: response regulator transcription factor [Thermoflexales bacterium]|nr:response regulator transcription factor [Thermoflexales bacterium]
MDKIRILIVDDHSLVRRGLRALLEAEPDLQLIGEAVNGADGVAQAAALRPDVVVMDISMPEMDGLEATRRIRAADPSQRVLILTVHAMERYLFAVLKAGASGYVLKSTIDTELIEAIRTVARGGAFLYPNAAQMLLTDYLSRARSSDEADAYERLSEREREVLRLIALGHSAAEIADQLALSPKSIETYRARIMEKLGLDSRPALVKYALARGLLSDAEG